MESPESMSYYCWRLMNHSVDDAPQLKKSMRTKSTTPTNAWCKNPFLSVWMCTWVHLMQNYTCWNMSEMIALTCNRFDNLLLLLLVLSCHHIPIHKSCYLIKTSDPIKPTFAHNIYNIHNIHTFIYFSPKMYVLSHVYLYISNLFILPSSHLRLRCQPCLERKIPAETIKVTGW